MNSFENGMISLKMNYKVKFGYKKQGRKISANVLMISVGLTVSVERYIITIYPSENWYH